MEAELGARIVEISSVRGGDINRAFRAELDDGRRVFVKTHPRPPEGVYAAEAAGLSWLRVEGGPEIPGVLAHDLAWLLLEWVESGPAPADFDEVLGRQLARMHLAGPELFGHVEDNFIANLPQSNRASGNWADFYGRQRILPLAQACTARGVWLAETEAAFELLVERLPERVGEPEDPARLHGDLWSGNVMRGAQGQPVLVDPAVYGGHREMDLAMMKLFGGFSEDCFAAYNEVYPLSEDWEERVDLWQLYPLLVHALLFGGGYAGRCVEIMRRWL
jgi:fructosamine-3-kinase